MMVFFTLGLFGLVKEKPKALTRNLQKARHRNKEGLYAERASKDSTKQMWRLFPNTVQMRLSLKGPRSTWTVCLRWVCEGVLSFLFLSVLYAILTTEVK